MRLENTGEIPLRIVADPYLLSFEIVVPAGLSAPAKGRKAAGPSTLRCSLPADMRPSSDVGRGLVLLPSKAYSESFDPRMYCFGAKESAGLVRGARAIAHYGFSPARAGTKGAATPSPPFAVSPIPSAERPADTAVASLKEVVAPAFELSDDAVGAELSSLTNPSPTAYPDKDPADRVASRTTGPVTPPITSPAQGAQPAGGDGLAPAFTVALPPRSDGARAADVNLTVSLTNTGPRKTSVYFRPQSIAFDVMGPGGAFSCPANGAGAIPELFTTLAPRGRTQLTVLAASSCPDLSFDLPGLYDVRPRLDTRRVTDSPPALHAFEGEAVGVPALVRIRRGKSGVLRPPPTAE